MQTRPDVARELGGFHYLRAQTQGSPADFGIRTDHGEMPGVLPPAQEIEDRVVRPAWGKNEVRLHHPPGDGKRPHAFPAAIEVDHRLPPRRPAELLQDLQQFAFILRIGKIQNRKAIVNSRSLIV